MMAHQKYRLAGHRVLQHHYSHAVKDARHGTLRADSRTPARYTRPPWAGSRRLLPGCEMRRRPRDPPDRPARPPYLLVVGSNKTPSQLYRAVPGAANRDPGCRVSGQRRTNPVRGRDPAGPGL